ncbi:MAG: hypothetical protein WC373_12685 [Smithella sp.]|jgi:hypothetical protein
MSAKTAVLKKVHREVRRTKGRLINDIAREIISVPLWERIKLAARIVFKGKL